MPRVLIIDDEELVRETVGDMVSFCGYEVLLAESGAKGLELCRSGPIDVVITDIIMPEQDGVQVVMSLRNHAPDIKIIAISGGGRTRNLDFLRIAKEMGAHTILKKPFDQQQLEKALADVLGK